MHRYVLQAVRIKVSRSMSKGVRITKYASNNLPAIMRKTLSVVPALTVVNVVNVSDFFTHLWYHFVGHFEVCPYKNLWCWC